MNAESIIGFVVKVREFQVRPFSRIVESPAQLFVSTALVPIVKKFLCRSIGLNHEFSESPLKTGKINE